MNSELADIEGLLCATSLQSCLTLCHPMDCSPPDSSVHEILQARILEWGAMLSSRGSSWPRDGTHGSYPHFTLEEHTLVAQVVKNPLARQERQEMQVWSLGQENPLKEEMATHPSILAWRISWTEQPGGLQSMGSRRVGHDWSDLAAAAAYIFYHYKNGRSRDCSVLW